MGVRGDALEVDAVLCESIFEACGAFIVEDVEDGFISVAFEEVVACCPSCGYFACLSA